ncbi:MAG TPA: phosphate acyltransferase PlsX [Candidatus Babeliales bacterium]|nr:phosphate acyltransferase PlsX [Candidatus Babeliales bacterium]
MVAVDAMGGDRAPDSIVQGAVQAAKQGVPILLCGPQKVLLSLLPNNWESLPITLEFCEQEIGMAEEPGRAVRSKPQSSLMRAMQAVASGRATAFFSAGNSGAVLVASVVVCGRVPGLHRPAVGTFLPTHNGSFFCLDVGGNVDCRADHLYQFALMGHAYLGVTKQMEYPRIGLLSNGHEPFKGSAEVKKAYALLSQSSLNFVGNIESREVTEGLVDIVVCDGFVGNVMLKAIQGTARTLFTWIKDEAKKSWFQSACLWLNRSLFQALKKRSDYASVGGALLLGIKKPIILAHGRSDALAVKNGILFAQQVVQENRVEKFNAVLQDLLEGQKPFNCAVKQPMRSFFHWGKYDA